MDSDSPSCKFCGDPCEPKEFNGIEIEMCGQCFREWKRMVQNT